MSVNKTVFKLLLPAIMLFSLSLGSVVALESNYEFWPGTEYNKNIPTIKDVLGYEPGSRISSPSDITKYFAALAQAAPEKIVIKPYAKSWEGRTLMVAAISSKSNIAQLDSLQHGMQKLSDPRKISATEAEKVIAELPGTIWLSHSVHGNEISSSDSAMMTAYHLLAATNDKRINHILNKTVVFIDPLQNPDGRNRFVQHYESSRGLVPDSSVLSIEHHEPWPNGRTNHYLFDMNRDWFALTQPESQGRAKIILEWFPLVFIDLHEMGNHVPYYFPPAPEPFNPHVTKAQWDNQEIFGRNNAKYFDQFGFSYFTRDTFDNFYPGYGASWPAHYGAIAMTYEQGSTAGLLIRRSDGTELSYRDAIRHHFVASISSAETVANNHKKLLEDFYHYRKTAIDEGRKETVKSYIIPTQFEQSTANKLADLLTKQGIEVLEANQSFQKCGQRYKAGSYVINAAQPAKRLIRNLLDTGVTMDESYLKEQERLRRIGHKNRGYDSVKAWSLPIMYNVQTNQCNKKVTGDFSLVIADQSKPGKATNLDASVAFLVPWGQLSSVHLLSHALRQGLIVKSSDKSFTNLGQRYPAGTLIFEVADNTDQLGLKLKRLASLTGADVIGVNDSWVTEGPNFGSDRVQKIAAPRVAIAWDQPTNANSAGSTRFVIEHQMSYPVTAIRTTQLARANLNRFHVLILPQTSNYYADNLISYLSILGAEGVKNLKDWVNNGGTLIAMGDALEFISHTDVDLLSVKTENRAGHASSKNQPQDVNQSIDNGALEGQAKHVVEGSIITSEKELFDMIAPETQKPEYVSGVLAKATVDKEHWLAAGVADELNVLVRGRNVYSPISLDRGHNVAYFKGVDDLLVSGYLREENRQQLAFKPFVVVEKKGRGHVIGFTQEPTFRAYLDGLNIIVGNAIFRGAAHSTPLR